MLDDGAGICAAEEADGDEDEEEDGEEEDEEEEEGEREEGGFISGGKHCETYPGSLKYISTAISTDLKRKVS